jgi:hypothetical protein
MVPVKCKKRKMGGGGSVLNPILRMKGLRGKRIVWVWYRLLPFILSERVKESKNGVSEAPPLLWMKGFRRKKD